jgi:site-specific recombinase XerD
MPDRSTTPPAPTDETDWQDNPLACFDAWLATQEFAQSSSEVYQVQWQHFVQWLLRERVPLKAVVPDTVERFLISLPIRQDQRQRYLRLIERVFNYLRRDTFGTVNPATLVALQPEHEWASVPPNEPTGFLGSTAYAALVDYLTDLAPADLTTVGLWRAQRDRTIVALFAGAGLKMRELQDLTVSCKIEDDWLILDARPRTERRAKLQPFAADLLRDWLALRAEAETAGSLVFPATRAGRAMHKATVLRATTDLIELAALPLASDSSRISPQTLRNSYAAAWFEAGLDIDTIALALGFKQLVSAQRLHGAWDIWQARAQQSG